MSVLDKITAKLDLLYLKEEDFKLRFRKKIGGAAFDKFYKEHLLKWKISDYKQLNKKKQEEFWTEFRDDWDKHPDAIDLDEVYLKYKNNYLGFKGSSSVLQFSPHTAAQSFEKNQAEKIRKKMADEIGIKPEAIQIVNEAKSGDQEAYQKFFQAKLKKYGVKSPSELDDDKKKKFFDEVEKGWKAKDESTLYEAKKIDWKDFYKAAKDKTGEYMEFKDFHEKYGKISMFPHIEDALKRTKTYDQFIKFIKQFENVDEAEAKSGDQEAYQKFFQAKLKKYGVKSPSELDDDKKKKFFDEIEKGWKGKDESTIYEAKYTGSFVQKNKEAFQRFFRATLKKYGVKSPSELDDDKKKKFFAEVDKELEKNDESTKIYEYSVPDQHQLKILKDLVKNPMKKFLFTKGDMDAEKAEEILKDKFRFTDAQIKKLKESTSLYEGQNFKKGDKLKISSHKSSPGKGLSYPDFDAVALEDGAIGGWDVYDVESKKSGDEESVYGFSIRKKLKESTESLSETKITVYDTKGKQELAGDYAPYNTKFLHGKNISQTQRYIVVIGKDVFGMSDDMKTNIFIGDIGEISKLLINSKNIVKVTSLPQAVQKAIKLRADDSEY